MQFYPEASIIITYIVNERNDLFSVLATIILELMERTFFVDGELIYFTNSVASW